MKINEIEDIIKRITNNEDFNTCNGYALEEYGGKINITEDGYWIKLTDTFGGEGMGDYMWYIFELHKNDERVAFFRVSGYYDSWNGTDWENICIVGPELEYNTTWAKVDDTITSNKLTEKYEQLEHAPSL